MLTYHEPARMTRSALEESFSSYDIQRIAFAMVSASLYEGDWAWAEAQFLRLATHVDPQIRGLAATCLSHLARIHRRLHLDIVVPVLHKLKEDPATSGMAEDALEDLKIYLPAT